MNSIIYVGMDVHSTSFTLCCYSFETDKVSRLQTIKPDYKLVLRYLERIRMDSANEIDFICGYEAGCLGYTLYHQLSQHGIKCIILAPSTMAICRGGKAIKTDSRDAENIAKCLAFNTYSPVFIPSHEDESVKEYIRMRDDHKLALKKIKQQILSFCLRHGYKYDKGSHWTLKHLDWLSSLQFDGLLQECFDEYLITYKQIADKIKRLDLRIEEISQSPAYADKVNKLKCFIGVKTHTALAIIAETGDFKRFTKAEKYAAFLGLVPGEQSSGDTCCRTGITKTGNSHLRTLLVEAAQCYGRGRIGYKSSVMEHNQQCCTSAEIAYIDRANERLRRRYYRLVLQNNIKANVAKIAIARELSCFVWGMMTDNIA